MFSWIPFYEELATHLLAYENRQPELAAMLDRLTVKGLKVGTLKEFYRRALGELPGPT
jgi:hypothetical protein